jgi:eukaryotic-like serine/threonine-protein kinase
VTGRRPFGGGSTAEMLASLLKEQPKPPTELVPDVPRELERIVLRCLRKDPARRFQSMLDVKIELQEVKEEFDSQPMAPAATAGHRSRWWRLTGIATGLVLVLAVPAAFRRLRPAEPPTPRLVELASATNCNYSSFSPDGSQIVFASMGETRDNSDIWLKIVGEAEARRLTTDPAPDVRPAWSPDGRQIAFVRHPPGSEGIYLVSPVGGLERRLVGFPAGGVSWSPDGRWVATDRRRAPGESTPESGGIYLIPVEGGEPRPLTFPKPPLVDSFPAFSPDGRALAYASCRVSEWAPPCDVSVLSLDSALRPRGEARRLTWQKQLVAGLAWSRDGHSLLLGSDWNLRGYMWRVRVDGGSPPERVELASRRAFAPSVARNQDRLAFARLVRDPSIHRLPLGGSPTPFLVSTTWDTYPQYSPDGRHVAFESGRSGDREEIWLADGDGSNPVRLTRGPGRWQGSPRWSPDGRTIVFDSRSDEGQWDIWTIAVDGSGLRQVTHDPSDANVPSFSRDGRWIYFGSHRTGRSEVWRSAVSGGTEEQVTHEGGVIPVESFDGRTLYYMRSFGKALLARPTAGGEERTIVRCVNAKSFAVGPRGIFHVDCAATDARSQSPHTIRYWDAVTGVDRAVGTFEGEETGALAISPDGRNILYETATTSVHLMMIENFR